MAHQIPDIIDIDRFRDLVEGLSEATNVVATVLDLAGNTLIETGQRDICTKFHLACSETAKRVTESKATLADRLRAGGEHMVQEYPNGLVDVAVPIVVEGEHIGNLCIGQFFFETPSRDFFRKQGAAFGFDVDAYLDAVFSVPVISETQIRNVIDFLLQLTSLLGDMGVNRIKQLEATEALRKSEGHYQGLVSEMVNGFALHEIICDNDGAPVDFRFLEVNAAFEKLTGLKGADVTGRTVRELLPKTDILRIARFGQVAITGRSDSFVDYSEELGKYFELHAYCPRKGEFAVLFTDVTDRKRARDRLEHSESEFRMLYENAPYGILICELIVDQEGKPSDTMHLEANATTATILGVELDTIVGRRGSEMVSPDEMALPLQTYGRVVSMGTPATYAQYSPAYDRTVEVSAFPLHHNIFIIHLIDISGRVRNELELAQYRDRLEKLVQERTTELAYLSREQQAILDSNPAMIWFKDTKNRILRVNRTVAEWLNLPVNEIEGKRCEHIFPEEAQRYRQDDLAVIRSGQPKFGLDESLKNVSGESRSLLTDRVPFQDESGNVVGVIVFALDITERKRAEKKLEDRSKELRRIAKVMAGREIRMAELSEVVKRLRAQIEAAGMTPVVDQPQGRVGS